jgi:exoribonuclease R
VPADPQHAALASEYAHVTAPLRRLGDRYAGEVCLALCAGDDVPAWVTERLHDLPATLQESGQRANRYERAVLDLVEAELLHHRVGESFRGVVVERDEERRTRGTVTVQEPAVEAPVTSSEELPLGEDVTVTLTTADPATRKVGFTVSPQP